MILFSCNGTQKEDVKTVEQISVNKPAPNADKELPNENTFEETAYSVIKAFEQKDEKSLNELVSTKHGVIVLFRTGVFNEYKHIDNVEFKNHVPKTFPYPAITIDKKIVYEDLPRFNCGTMEWSKHGIYCDTIKKDTLLSGTPLNLIKYRGDKISESQVNKFKELEKISRRVILATPKDDFIFHLALIDNKWYLIVIDRITTDCSA